MTAKMRLVHWLCRIVLAAVLLYSGYVKSELNHSTLQFASAISGYKAVPEKWVYPLAQYFPWLEIALGAWILTGWKIGWSSMAASGLMLLFIGLLSITLYRGIDTNCGCFGFGDRITWKTIVRDGSLFLPALYLVVESWIRKRKKEAALTPSAAQT